MKKQEAVFWNEWPIGFPDCDTDFTFSHQLATLGDVVHMFFSTGLPLQLVPGNTSYKGNPIVVRNGKLGEPDDGTVVGYCIFYQIGYE